MELNKWEELFEKNKIRLEKPENLEMNLIDLETELDKDGKILNEDQKKSETLLDHESTALKEDPREEIEAFGLDPEDIKLYREAFDDFDHNHDEQISTQVKHFHCRKIF